MSKRHLIILAGLLLVLILGGLLLFQKLYISQEVRFAMNLGTGWNAGNSLDAHGLGRKADELEHYETYWGNPPISQSQVKAIAEAGFKTLRLPVTWYEHLDDQRNIDPEWLQRVQTVIDWALDEGFFVILNAHHDAWYEPSTANERYALDSMQHIWSQIADYFAAYDERLLFESMNEPRLIGDPQEWTSGTPEARTIVNRLNATFVATIRAASGWNQTRYLLIPAYCASIEAEALSALAIPNDRRVIVSAHLYKPYAFALDESGTASWSAQQASDIEEICSAINRLYQHFTSKGIPVVITEFGAFDKNNETARASWAKYVLITAHENRISCLWWDTTLLQQPTLTWRYPMLLNALTQ